MSPWLIVAAIALIGIGLVVWAFVTAPEIEDDFLGEISKDDF
jgi:hypothetical protein